MKRMIAVVALGVGLMVGGCSHGSSTGPSALPVANVSIPVTSGGVSSVRPKEVKGGVSADVSFSATELGKVTIRNTSGETHTFTLAVWDASDEVNQVLKAQQSATILAGSTATVTLAFEQTCGTKYQRDVYLDMPAGMTTLSDMQNYFFAAPGVFWQSEVGTCEIGTVVTVTPPQEEPRCEDREANNYGGLLPCTFGEGGSGPVLCQDPTANNVGGALPCTYNPPPPPTACMFPDVATTPIDEINAVYGVNNRLTLAQSYVPGVAASGNAGGSFGGNDAIGTFTPSQDYAVVEFHKGNKMRVFTGLHAGVSYFGVWTGNGVSSYTFNCPVQ